MTTAITSKKLSVKTQTIGAFIALVSAVALPQLVHVIGAASGMGTSLGEIFLPMHLPIILMGFLVVLMSQEQQVCSVLLLALR